MISTVFQPLPVGVQPSEAQAKIIVVVYAISGFVSIVSMVSSVSRMGMNGTLRLG